MVFSKMVICGNGELLLVTYAISPPVPNVSMLRSSYIRLHLLSQTTSVRLMNYLEVSLAMWIACPRSLTCFMSFVREGKDAPHLLQLC